MAKNEPAKAKTQQPRSYHLKAANAVDSLREAYFFNRFDIEVVDGFHLIYLGVVVNGEVLSSHIMALHKTDVENVYKTAKDYISHIGSVSVEPPREWDRPRSKKLVFAANVLQISSAGEVGEVEFANYGMHELAMVRKGTSNELVGRRLYIGRSTLELHRQFLGNLFRGLE